MVFWMVQTHVPKSETTGIGPLQTSVTMTVTVVWMIFTTMDISASKKIWTMITMEFWTYPTSVKKEIWAGFQGLLPITTVMDVEITTRTLTMIMMESLT